MIDYIKFFIQPKERFENRLLDNDTITLKGAFDYNTGEILDYPKRGHDLNMKINITEKGASVEGSVHKYWNNLTGIGDHNYNDMSFCNVLDTISIIEERLEVESAKTKLTNLEFGFNLQIEESPEQLINHSVLMFNYKPPNRLNRFKGKGDFKQFDMTDYSLKIYNKSKQYSLRDKNIIRIELKITRSRFLKRLGINTLLDINPITVKNLKDELLRQFDKLQIIDSIKDCVHDTAFDHTKYIECTNPFQWDKWKSSKTPKRLDRLKKQFQKFLKDNNMLKTKTALRRRIEESFEKLNFECQSAA